MAATGRRGKRRRRRRSSSSKDAPAAQGEEEEEEEQQQQSEERCFSRSHCREEIALCKTTAAAESATMYVISSAPGTPPASAARHRTSQRVPEIRGATSATTSLVHWPCLVSVVTPAGVVTKGLSVVPGCLPALAVFHTSQLSVFLPALAVFHTSQHCTSTAIWRPIWREST